MLMNINIAAAVMNWRAQIHTHHACFSCTYVCMYVYMQMHFQRVHIIMGGTSRKRNAARPNCKYVCMFVYVCKRNALHWVKHETAPTNGTHTHTDAHTFAHLKLRYYNTRFSCVSVYVCVGVDLDWTPGREKRFEITEHGFALVTTKQRDRRPSSQRQAALTNNRCEQRWRRR